MSYIYLLLLLSSVVLFLSFTKSYKESIEPTKKQKAMIGRKYGMFLCFGINTYLDIEWSNGTDSAEVYAPPGKSQIFRNEIDCIFKT